MRRTTLLTCTAALLVAAAAPAPATVLITVEEALALAFPGAAVVRETLFLTDEQLRAAAELAGSAPGSALVTRFVARGGDGKEVGCAYLDTHVVRTLPETVLVVLGPDGAVRRVEVVVFREPTEYLPREGWYRQYDGRVLDDELELKRGIRPVTGATLTASATTAAVRRVLAIHRVTGEGEGR